MTHEQKAERARRRAVKTYERYARRALIDGDQLWDTNPESAVRNWLGGMAALTAAAVAARGLRADRI